MAKKKKHIVSDICFWGSFLKKCHIALQNQKEYKKIIYKKNEIIVVVKRMMKSMFYVLNAKNVLQIFLF